MTSQAEMKRAKSARALFKPFIPASLILPELTPLPLILGTLLGVVFGASSLYLVLKVGLTVSASIPVAVISISLYRIMGRFGVTPASILQHNIVQTAGSAGESIAFGIGVTMPAILILGFDLEILRVTMVAVFGGLMGILMMIPLRRALIVDQHGILKYPEGTACAVVLKAAASPEEQAIAREAAGEEAKPNNGVNVEANTIFWGFIIGVTYKIANVALRLWKDTPSKVFGAPFAGGSIAAEISPELLGVGYIIGPQIAATMCAGGVLAYLMLIPMIKYFGEASGIIAPALKPLTAMSPDQVRGAYILYIGAGAVAAGGLISMIRSMPTIWRGITGGIADFQRERTAAPGTKVARTDRDLSPRFVVIGIIVLLAAMMVTRSLNMNLLGAVLLVMLGFLFVTVSSRLTGEVGSSSNPISGMTIATLLITCLVFLALGWTGPDYYVTALSVGGIVCIASSNGGTTSQDLKTGFLLGATPRAQQIAILVGALASALMLGPILMTLNENGTVYVPVTGVEAMVSPDKAAVLPVEKLIGPQARQDDRTYHIWHKTDRDGAVPGRYLLDDAGVPAYLVDPGINGTERVRPDGSPVPKFEAPKATLISYIIKGILNQQLPWSLVILGVMISLVLEMIGVASLPFAVGVYLPLSTTVPIYIGGLVRWVVDRIMARRMAHHELTEEELAAEADRGPGVLLASGYIAGGAIAGIAIAFMAGVMTDWDTYFNDVMTAGNPFFNGPYASGLSLIPFALLTWNLYRTARRA
jgi:putative OPT family oligopeptide transporter